MADAPIIARRTIDIAAGPAKVWEIVASPGRWPEWMMVPPEPEPGRTTLDIGSAVQWKNDDGETYLTGTVTTLERERCLVLELEDVSWKRPAAPGEVTYALTIEQAGDHTHVEFRLGDLAIDPKGREWCQAYADSRELENIKALAEAE